MSRQTAGHVTVVVGPLVDGDVVETVDKYGLVLREDRWPVVVAFGNARAVRVPLLDVEVNLTCRCPGSKQSGKVDVYSAHDLLGLTAMSMIGARD